MSMDRLTNILLVDDDEIDVMNVRRAFEKGKIQNPLFHAEDGLVALEMLQKRVDPEDQAPGAAGPEHAPHERHRVPAELRKDPELHGTAVVVLTTSDEERDRLEAYNFHVAGYLVKPVRFQAFVELMTTLNRYWMLMEMA